MLQECATDARRAALVLSRFARMSLSCKLCLLAALDSEYWVCFCFQTRAQKEEFLHAAKLIALGDKYIDGQKAAFHLKGVKVAELGQSGSCEAGLFTPGLRTKVTYGRLGDGVVEITVTPPPDATTAAVGLLDRLDGRPLERYTKPIVMEQDSSCQKPDGEAQAMRLPIWGNAQIGREFRPAAGAGPPEPSLLIDGKLDVSAHAFLTRSLYDVRTVTLPVGSKSKCACCHEP